MTQKAKKPRVRSRVIIAVRGVDGQMALLLTDRLGRAELATLSALTPKDLYRTVQAAFHATSLLTRVL